MFIGRGRKETDQKPSGFLRLAIQAVINVWRSWTTRAGPKIEAEDGRYIATHDSMIKTPGLTGSTWDYGCSAGAAEEIASLYKGTEYPTTNKNGLFNDPSHLDGNMTNDT